MTRLEKSAETVDAALARLRAALEQLERTVAARLEDDLSSAELEEELAIMQDDRGSLALELDDALARVSALEKARDEVLRRLDDAGEGVAAALGAAVARLEE
jgi:predicted RNase H-like nuclease (RuvC/YqgF family)